jgi:cephalosporin-C deacetylase
VGGARIHAKYLRPRNAPAKHPAVLKFHGYTAHAGDWNWHMQLAAAGFSVFAMDCRGQGGSSEDTNVAKGMTYLGHVVRGLDDSPEKLLFRQIFLDTAQLARVAASMPEVDPERMGAEGGSQGGGLTLACAALEPHIKRAAACYPFLGDYQKRFELDQNAGGQDEFALFFRNADPQHEREEEYFTRLGYIDVQHLAPRIQAEVLMGTALKDKSVPPVTQFAIFNRIRSKKRVELYPDFGHESLPGFGDKVFQFFMGL